MVRVAFALILLFWSSFAHAEKRVALVIGNGAYTKVPTLDNPKNDSAAMEAMFKGAGFDAVVLANDLGIVAMRRALRDFADTAHEADVAIVFYAGHGMEVSGTNYLIPVDAVLERDIDARDEAVSLDRVNEILEPMKRLRLVILDACRDNPFVRSMRRTMATRAVRSGYGEIDEKSLPPNTLVAYAQRAGSTADDGVGANSPYTTALLKHLPTPGLDVELALRRVRDDVLKTTRNRQEPFKYGSLGGTEIALVPAKPLLPEAVTSPKPTIDYDKEMEITFWRSILSTRNPKEFKAYIERYPNGVYVGLARERIALLEKALRSGSGQQGMTFLRLLPEAIVPERASQASSTGLPPEPDVCDRLTASPFDRERLAPGITLAEISAEVKRVKSEEADKTLGCGAALSQQGQNPRLLYQSARALLAQSIGAPSDAARTVWPWEGAPSTEAMAALREAAEEGSSAAMVELGRMAFQGVGSEKNQIQALDWWQRAAAQGDGLSMALLGVVYAGGYGAPQDQALALSWARHALDYGVARQVMLLNPLREFVSSGDKPFRKVGMRWAELLSEHVISRFGSDKGAPELVLGLAYPLLVGDDALADYWLRRSVAAGNSAAVLHIALSKVTKNPNETAGELVALYRTAMGAGEPVSKALLGIAATRGTGIPRDDRRARELIQEFLASGFVSEALKVVVDVIGADMRHAGFSQSEVETHCKLLMSALDGLGTQPGDAEVIVTLLGDQTPLSSPLIEDRLAAPAAAGNTNAMLALAFAYLDNRGSAAAQAAEKRSDEWRERQRAIEASPGSLPADVQAVFTPEERREYEQLAHTDGHSSKSAKRQADQERLGQLTRMALERITKSIGDDLERENTKSRELNRQRAAEWISKAAERGSPIALAIDALLQARGFAGSARRDVAEARARQLVATGFFDLSAFLLEYAVSRVPVLLGPGEDDVELTQAERSAVRGIVRRLFDGIRERNDLVRPLLAMSLLVPDHDGRDPAQVQAEALDWLRTVSRRDNNALANLFLAAHHLLTSGDTTKFADGALKSINYLRFAAERGEPLAQLALGIMYARGNGVARDEIFARRWVEMALGGGKLGEDVGKLAPIVRKLMNKAPDKVHLVSRLSDTLAADKGQAEALIAFALLFPQPDADVKNWLERAADAGNAPAKALLVDAEFDAALTAAAR